MRKPADVRISNHWSNRELTTDQLSYVLDDIGAGFRILDSCFRMGEPGRRLNKSTMDLFELPLSVQLMPATSGNEPICEGKLVSLCSKDFQSKPATNHLDEAPSHGVVIVENVLVPTALVRTLSFK